ncbi:MAG: TRAP transporter large permease [Chloroflexota bacterium]
MDSVLVAVIGLLILFTLIALRMPIGYAMGTVGFVGAGVIIGFKSGASLLGISPFHSAMSYFLAVVPLFVLMGSLATLSGVSRDGYNVTFKWLGHLPGGLAVATIGGCAGFAAVCGSSTASAVTMGKVALGAMKAYNYKPQLSMGSIAAGGTLGVLIPPSMGFVIYGIITEQSIGRLFLAGIIPGIILTGLFMLTVYILARRDPTLGPPGARTPWPERLKSLKDAWGVALMFFIVMGGIWGGLFTPTEAAAVGVIIALFIVVIRRQFSVRKVADCLMDTVRTTGMLMVIVIGALIYNYFLALSGLPRVLAAFITDLTIPALGVLAVILVIYFFLGCVMEVLSMVMLTLPIFFPTVVALGYDPIWFGVIVILMNEMAMITPPVGLNVYALAGINPDVPMETIFKGAAPFTLALAAAVIINIMFPQIALLLPNTMIG